MRTSPSNKRVHWSNTSVGLPMDDNWMEITLPQAKYIKTRVDEGIYENLFRSLSISSNDLGPRINNDPLPFSVYRMYKTQSECQISRGSLKRSDSYGALFLMD